MPNPDQTNMLHQEVTAEQVGQRLDRYVVAMLPNISRSEAQRLIAEGSVLVNGSANKPGYALRERDRVEILQARLSAPFAEIKPQEIPLEVVYEDDDLLIVNKAAGMVVHPAPGHYKDTLVNALLARYPNLQASEQETRPGIVHRLDRDTSGLLIVAKNLRTQAALIEEMKQHRIVKRYLALVEGNVSHERGSIDAPIGRDARNRQQMAITSVDSREARTHFRVMKRFARHTLLLLELETGRTHQIRVHLQAIGHPVVADPVYGSGRSHPAIALKRQFLHAYQLSFIHPSSGEKVEFEAPLPADLQAILEKERDL